MNKVKYFATYQGPSYGMGGWETTYDAYSSLKAAMESMWHRQIDGSDTITAYTETPSDGLLRLLEEDVYYRFPATSREDVMWLYHAIRNEEEDGWSVGDVAYLITVGPRGGIRPERA